MNIRRVVTLAIKIGVHLSVPCETLRAQETDLVRSHEHEKKKRLAESEHCPSLHDLTTWIKIKGDHDASQGSATTVEHNMRQCHLLLEQPYVRVTVPSASYRVSTWRLKGPVSRNGNEANNVNEYTEGVSYVSQLQ